MRDLLQPSLSQEVPTRPIYSAQAGFWVAFLGGPVGIALFGALNAHRLGRLRREWALYAAGVGLFLFLGMAFLLSPASIGIDPHWAGNLGRGFRLGSRALALIYWLGVFLLHRRFYRAATLLGEDPPSPWRPAIALTVVGSGVTLAMAYLSLHLTGTPL